MNRPAKCTNNCTKKSTKNVCLLHAAVVGQRLIQLEGEGVALTHDGGAGRVLDAQEGRRHNHRLAAAGDNPVVQAGEQVGSGDLGAGAQDAAALLRERELVPRENVLVGEGLPHGGQTLENTLDLDLGLVLGPDRTAIAAVADILAPANYLSRQIEGGPWLPLLVFDDELVVLVVNRDSPNTLHRKKVNRNQRYALFRSIERAERPEQVEQRSQPGAALLPVIPGKSCRHMFQVFHLFHSPGGTEQGSYILKACFSCVNPSFIQ